MSAALVESVREAERLENVPGAWHEADVARNALDLTAILAALTEAEALRAQVAASQAREVALRGWLTAIANDNRNGRGEFSYDEFSYKRREAELQDAARKALSAPTDTAALRAMLRAAWIDGIDGDDGSNSADAYIDRVLGGS